MYFLFSSSNWIVKTKKISINYLKRTRLRRQRYHLISLKWTILALQNQKSLKANLSLKHTTPKLACRVPPALTRTTLLKTLASSFDPEFALSNRRSNNTLPGQKTDRSTCAWTPLKRSVITKHLSPLCYLYMIWLKENPATKCSMDTPGPNPSRGGCTCVCVTQVPFSSEGLCLTYARW